LRESRALRRAHLPAFAAVVLLRDLIAMSALPGGAIGPHLGEQNRIIRRFALNCPPCELSVDSAQLELFEGKLRHNGSPVCRRNGWIEPQ
jgi:hypothetical protein